ncbi:spexin isoform B [Alligator mississippiensis]|uniref:Spexin isoform B n=1 Tax=Alligator mississippiensis TaxID=8496 RepID=A0A151NJ69_ALLMI|nr:spexin isoform B [Alligator mississippiensis]
MTLENNLLAFLQGYFIDVTADDNLIYNKLPKGLRRLTASAMALFLAASLISYSWSAPQGHFQRRNWTPQAMLYLKGAQGRRFISDESQRKDLYDRLQLETRSQNSNPVSLSEAAALFLSSFRKAQEEAEEETSDHPGYLTNNLLNW